MERSTPPLKSAAAMRDVYLGLGSNIGNKTARIQLAIARIAESMVVQRLSSLYETAPVGFLDQDWFLNCVVEVETERTAHEAADLLGGLELEMGRRRETPGGPRTIDIDILFFGTEIIDEKGLQVPHPRLHQRLFVLAPMAELRADFVHPVLGVTVAEAARKLAGTQEIRRVER